MVAKPTALPCKNVKAERKKKERKKAKGQTLVVKIGIGRTGGCTFQVPAP
jgi:hypothetical protein